MASSLSFSTFDTNQSNNLSVSKIQSQSRRKNKTIKKKPTKKVENFLNSINEGFNDIEDSNESGLANFEPMGNPIITKAPDDKKEESMPPQVQSDDPVSVEQFETINQHELSENNYKNYMNTYVPYYTKTANQANLHGSKDQLMKKLNYMIHLLEKQEDEKTSNVTEELVLYMFLGVFTIFCVDSFARAGKYTR
tara:strand:+ start:53 stop:634 length:582 start_codon:yes stop_codon:yes gene_type:complete